jgi:hypothetical protein
MARWYHVSGDAKWTGTRVKSYAAYGGEEEPYSFDAGSVQMDVQEVVDRWSLANHSYFKVKTRSRALCILRYDKGTRQWEMTPLAPMR